MSVPKRSHAYRWLAVLPPLFMLVGVPFVNRLHGTVLGLPPLLTWSVVWVVLTSVTMGLIWVLDRRDSR